MLAFDLAFAGRVYVSCCPVFLNEFFWITGVSMYKLVYACMGTHSFTTVGLVLRGAGNTKCGFMMDLSAVWCIGKPVVFAGAFALKWPVYGVLVLVVHSN